MKPSENYIGCPVRSLQTMLRVLSFDDNDLLPVIPDGIYGSQTRNAVSAFQKKHALPITGAVDQQTWVQIVDCYESAKVRLDAAHPLQLIMNPNQVICKGNCHPYVLLAQAMLSSIAQVHGSIIAPNLTGEMDETTTYAISSLQHLCNLPQTGELDKITWMHLSSQYPLAVNIQECNNKRILSQNPTESE